MTLTTVARTLALALSASMALAACSSSQPSSTASNAAGGDPAMTASDGPAMTASDGPAMSEGPAMSDGPAMSPSAAPAMSDGPAMTASHGPAMSDGPGASASASAALAAHVWAAATLTDVSTGQTFTIASLAGKPVFVEAMAIWCTNCRAQQGRFTEAFGKLPNGAAEYVVLTIDPSETAADLARYKQGRGFAGRYAVAGKDVSAALQAEFGANVLNPPSVPLIFISPSGEVQFSTGPESVDEIVGRVGA